MTVETPPSSAMIRVQRVTRDYGSHRAVDGLEFEVPRGEVVGFLGPNGAGKSTTLRMIAGFLEPTSGTIQVNGIDVVRKPIDARRVIGYMPEATPLYTEMRVEEYLRFRAEIKGVPRAKRADEMARVLAATNTQDVSRTVIGTLSKGYRQRVGLADALIGAPPLLILDEPTAGLDPNQIREVRALIRSLSPKHTVLISTHILQEVEAMCSRAIILARGRIVAQGTTDAIRAETEQRGEKLLELVVRGTEDVVRRALEPLGTLDTVETRADETLACVLRIESTDDLNGRVEDVVAACVKESLGVREVKLRTRSLEDVFREVTRRDDPSSNDSSTSEAPQ